MSLLYIYIYFLSQLKKYNCTWEKETILFNSTYMHLNLKLIMCTNQLINKLVNKTLSQKYLLYIHFFVFGKVEIFTRCVIVAH